jgi:hypothetical protein
VLPPLASRIGAVPALLLREQLLKRRLLLLRLNVLLLLLRHIDLDPLLRRIRVNLDLARRRYRLRRLVITVSVIAGPPLLPALVLPPIDARLLAVRPSPVFTSKSAVLAERGDVTQLLEFGTEGFGQSRGALQGAVVALAAATRTSASSSSSSSAVRRHRLRCVEVGRWR